jgi:predicted dehydrogenase
LLNASPEIAEVRVVDVAPAARAQAQAEGFVAYADLVEAYASGFAPDVAHICTPNGLHAAGACECLARGSHVVVEKPLALTTMQAERIIATAAQHHRHVFGVLQNRYSAVVRWLFEVLGQQALGPIRTAQVNCFWNRDHRYYLPGSWKGTRDLDGGVLFTQFSHFIDLMLQALGPLEVVSAELCKANPAVATAFPDTGIAVLRTGSGAPVGLQFSTAVPHANYESSVLLVGERGVIKLGGQYMNTLVHCAVPGLAVPEFREPEPPNVYAGYAGSANNHHLVVRNVVETLKGQAQPDATAEEGRAVVRLIEAIHAAARV